MSDISPEDKQTLVKAKFRELLHEVFEEEANEWHKKRSTQQPQPHQQPAQGSSQAPQRKHSLFEEVLGIG